MATSSHSQQQARSERSAAAVRVDNLIRQRLRITDPTSASEVAEGLRRVYQKDAQALDQESLGFARGQQTPVREASMGDSPSSTELDQSIDDVDQDLRSLTGDSQLKDIHPELTGWGHAIRSVVSDGVGAARLALDSRQRAAAMGARRKLGDFARLARLTGTLTPSHYTAYRRLAQSLDQVAALILVLAGESLSRTGLGGGRTLPQAPASELQARRDAIMAALRNLTGSTQESYAADQWPRGLHALRRLLDLLEQSGHGELRALVDENHMAQALDALIDRAASVNARGLRELGATAPITLEQLNRLLLVSQFQVDPESPPLAAFRNALRLFIDGFRGGNGQRLLAVARPALVSYGIYGLGTPDQGTERLTDLVELRGRLAFGVDCFLGCNCDRARVITQAVLDKVLCDLDRAIDFYVQGSDPNGDGEPEQRASASGVVAGLLVGPFANFNTFQQFVVAGSDGPALPIDAELLRVRQQLINPPHRLGQNITTMANLLSVGALAAGFPIWDLNPGAPDPANEVERRRHDRALRMRETLTLQRDSELRWRESVRTMAPNCVNITDVHQGIDGLLAAGLFRVARITNGVEILDDIPPHEATALAGLVYLRPSEGAALP